jgi:hypothetical protein
MLPRSTCKSLPSHLQTLAAGVGFEPTIFWFQRPAHLTTLPSRNKLGRLAGIQTPMNSSRGSRPVVERRAYFLLKAVRVGFEPTTGDKLLLLNRQVPATARVSHIKFFPTNEESRTLIQARDSSLYRTVCSIECLGRAGNTRTHLRILCRWCKRMLGSEQFHSNSTVRQLQIPVKRNVYFPAVLFLGADLVGVFLATGFWS